MENLREEFWRLVITVIITILVIAGGAWYEHRTGTLESLIKLPEPALETTAE